MKEAVAIIGGTLVGIGLIAGFLESAGPPELEPNPLAMHIHGVDADDLRELALQGLEVPHLDDALAFRIHGVTSAFIEEMVELGYALDPDHAVAFRIHGVTPPFLRAMRAQGLDLSADDAVAFRIHGIDDAFIDSLRDQGFDDLGPDELIEMKILGPGRVLAKRERR
jgi:hypothetical protein